MSSMDEANKTALDTLYSKYGSWLYKWLLRRLGSSDLAEDLVQTTFLALAERPHLDASIEKLAQQQARVREMPD